MSDISTLVVSYWYEDSTKELVFDWPATIAGVKSRINIELPSTPEFANPTHSTVFKKAQGVIAAQLLIARLNYKGPIELNPLAKPPTQTPPVEQLSFSL